jgi:hypothetical protein
VAAILTLLLVIGFSMLVTKIATIALVHTGMSREVARFQARSALSGAGFTTSASEKVVNHPVRRRIISLLILVGSAGLVTAISSLLLGVLQPDSSLGSVQNLAVLFLGVALLLASTRSARIDRGLSRVIERLLERYTDLRVRRFSQLISLGEDYEISEIDVKANPWLAEHTIAETRLIDEGILVLGIHRDPDTYLGTPRGDYRIREGDRLVVYGRRASIVDVSQRDDPLEAREAHAVGRAEQQALQREQDAQARAEERSD